MPPPPPPPPPNAPPPPKVNTDGGVKRTGGGGDAGAGRGMLLSSIHQGAKLKKVVTNDRSSPQIGKINNGPSGGIESSPSAFKEGSSTGPPISGMFAGGMPKLRPAAEKGKPGGAVGTAILPPGRRSLPQTNEPNQSTTLSSNASSNVPPMTSSMASGSSAFSGQRLPAPSSVNSKPPPPPSRDISYDQQKMGPASVQNESNSTMNLPNSSKGPLPPSTPSRSIAPTPQLSVRGQPPSLGNQPPPAPNRSAGPSSSSRVAPPPPPSRDSSSNRNLPPPPPVRGNVSLSQSEPLRRISSSSSISGSEISISLPPPPPVHRSSVINPPTYQRSPTGDDQQPPPPPPPRVNGNRASFPPPPVLSDSNIEARFQFLSDIPDPDPFRNIQKTYPSKAPRNTEKRSQGQVNLPNRSAPPPPPSGRGAPTPPPPPPNRR